MTGQIQHKNLVAQILRVSLCLMSHQQLRSYGDRTTALSLIRQTGGAGDQTGDPGYKASGLSTTARRLWV